MNFETDVKVFCNSLSRENKNRQLPKQKITVVTWKPLTLSFLSAPLPGIQEQLTIMGRKPLRTGSKGGYFEESVIEKKSWLAGLEFAHVKCMCVCLPQCTKDSSYKPPSTNEENWSTGKYIEGFLSLSTVCL